MRSACSLLVVAVVAGRASADMVSGYVVDHDRAVPHAAVRVVGARVVVITKADAHGHFVVNGLPAGSYRVELDHGVLAIYVPNHDPPHVLRLDRDASRPLCFLRQRRFTASLGARQVSTNAASLMPNGKPRGFVDTTSTALETHLVFLGH
jgi:hypothetical protein